jgi:putative zinc finger/helix-turn-helix YgiT family protein
MSSEIAENYHYEESGLPGVWLAGVRVSQCPGCGETAVSIPAVEQLHLAIASVLVSKPQRLAPPEIRFLRKYLGLSGVDFAAHMGVTPESVSRWENGAMEMSTTAERLLRHLVARQAPLDDYKGEVMLRSATGERAPSHLSLHWQRGPRNWQAGEAA